MLVRASEFMIAVAVLAVAIALIALGVIIVRILQPYTADIANGLYILLLVIGCCVGVTCCVVTYHLARFLNSWVNRHINHESFLTYKDNAVLTGYQASDLYHVSAIQEAAPITGYAIEQTKQEVVDTYQGRELELQSEQFKLDARKKMLAKQLINMGHDSERKLVSAFQHLASIHIGRPEARKLLDWVEADRSNGQ